MNSLQSAISTWGPGSCANIGGPRSRTRKERVFSSLLGKSDGVIRCRHHISLGLKFDDLHPVDRLECILAEAGFKDPEELRNVYTLPCAKLICSPLPYTVKRLPVPGSSHDDVLHQALMLGLCTAQIFDPQRPVLWTRTSLTRAVALFEPGGFYA